jgi:hypothetical protein
VRGACAEGLAAAVCAADSATPTQAAAARLLLAELNRRPRSETVPAWQAAAGVCTAVAQGDAAAKNRMPWHAALRALVDDDAASGFARAEAVKALRRLQAPAAWFTAWRARYGRAEFGAEGMVRRALGPPPP